MRGRWIKAEFWKSLTMAELSPDARLTFIGLWNYVDDEGRGVDHPQLIKSEIRPLDADVTAETIDRYMDEYVRLGRVVRYEASGRRYFAIPSFSEHQTVSHPKASILPPPPLAEVSGNAPGTVPPKGISTKPTATTERGKPRERKPVERNPLVDALAAIEGANPAELSRSHARKLGVAVAEIKSAAPDVTAAEIRRRAGIYRRKYPTWELTGPALAAHWAACGDVDQPAEPCGINGCTTDVSGWSPQARAEHAEDKHGRAA